MPATRSLRLTIARPSVFSDRVRSESIVELRYFVSVCRPTPSLISNSKVASPRGSTE
jgi:hypothetical protein